MEEQIAPPNQAQRELSLDERKFIDESLMRKRELALKEREVVAKEKELRRSRWLNPTVIGLFAATTGLFGNLIVAFIGSRNSQELEHTRAQSSLIVQAVSTGDAKAACKNLLSFMRLGLLDDPKGTIGRCESSLNTIPVLPAARTYTPVVEKPADREMAPVVTQTDMGETYHYDVAFVVPAVEETVKEFTTVQIYAMQADKQDKRVNDVVLPEVHGKWKVGDRIAISADLKKSYVDDPDHRTFLRYCVGSADICLPGPNLLLSGNR